MATVLDKGVWKTERLVLLGQNGKWVETYSAEVPVGDILDVQALSYRSGSPLQGGLELSGYGLASIVAPAPAVGAFYTIRGTLADAFENFGSLDLHGTTLPLLSIEDGVPAYAFSAASQQYASLPATGGANYDLLGLVGGDGTGLKFWEIAGKFKPTAWPGADESVFVVFSGTFTQHIAVWFTSDGVLHAQAKNGAFAQELTLPGAMALDVWTGFAFRHRPGSPSLLELEIHTGAATSVAVNPSIYFVPAVEVPIQIGAGLSGASTTAYLTGVCRDVSVRNAAMSAPALVAAVIDPTTQLQIIFKGVADGIEHDVGAYLLSQTASKITMSVPDLPGGNYWIICRLPGHADSTKRFFTVRSFNPRSIGLHIDFEATSMAQIHAALMVGHKQWGGANGGTSNDNVTVNRVAGLCELTACGNLYAGPVQGVDRLGQPSGMNTRIGACLISRDYYGPGRYRVVLKPIQVEGVCNAIWSFHYEEGYPGSEVMAQHQADGLHASGTEADGYYTVRNHEIDIEFPTALKTTPDQEQVAFSASRFNCWLGELRNWDVPNKDVPQSDPMYSAVDDPAYWSEYTDDFVQHGVNLADGQFHELGYDWHLGSDPRVEFYIDGVLRHTVRTHVPTIPGRFWVGVWFPSGATLWAGSNANWATQTMLVRSIDIAPFASELQYARNVAESYPNDVFRDFIHVQDA